jgi:hypothetical protein
VITPLLPQERVPHDFHLEAVAVASKIDCLANDRDFLIGLFAAGLRWLLQVHLRGRRAPDLNRATSEHIGSSATRLALGRIAALSDPRSGPRRATPVLQDVRDLVGHRRLARRIIGESDPVALGRCHRATRQRTLLLDQDIVQPFPEQPFHLGPEWQLAAATLPQPHHPPMNRFRSPRPAMPCPRCHARQPSSGSSRGARGTT